MDPLKLKIAAAAAAGILAGAARSPAQVRETVTVEDFLGSSGQTASGLVRRDLVLSGVITVQDAGARWTVRGSSSGGRIEGAVVDESGQTRFTRHYDLPDLRDNVHDFSDDIVRLVAGVPGLAATKIAFVGHGTGRPEIYVADFDGAQVQRVTTGGHAKGAPSIGPGAILLAWTDYGSGFPDIRLMDLRDGESRVVINAPGTNSGAAFSPDGSLLALSMTAGGDSEIFVSTITGSRVRRLTNSRSVEFSPSWSPDGDRIVFCSDATGSPQLFVTDIDGGEPQRIETGYRFCTSPDWSPDGRNIVFTAGKGRKASVAVYDMTIGQSRNLLEGARDPCWAPDGRHIACVSGQSIVILDAVTGSRRTLVTGMGEVREPSWSR